MFKTCESLHCIPVPYIILYIHCTSININKNLKRKRLFWATRIGEWSVHAETVKSRLESSISWDKLAATRHALPSVKIHWKMPHITEQGHVKGTWSQQEWWPESGGGNPRWLPGLQPGELRITLYSKRKLVLVVTCLRWSLIPWTLTAEKTARRLGSARRWYSCTNSGSHPAGAEQPDSAVFIFAGAPVVWFTVTWAEGQPLPDLLTAIPFPSTPLRITYFLTRMYETRHVQQWRSPGDMPTRIVVAYKLCWQILAETHWPRATVRTVRAQPEFKVSWEIITVIWARSGRK